MKNTSGKHPNTRRLDDAAPRVSSVNRNLTFMVKRSSLKLSGEKRIEVLNTLKIRFEKNGHRHKGINWVDVQEKLELEDSQSIVQSLAVMDETGGEPDVVGYNKDSGEYILMDCSKESPLGRRSLCYDMAGWESRKKHRPAGNAVDEAKKMGVELLTEEEYRHLQQLGTFDTTTSSWLKTPEEIRQKGGAIFGDYRYGRVFFYHNGAQSYYGSRGFRGILRV